MKIALLSSPHPTYDATTWRRYDALYRGGEVFRAAVQEFLPKNPMEPDATYQARCGEAHFTSYAGPILDWFSAKVCAASLVVRATADDGEPAPIDDFYGVWKEDVDGAGTDLIDFVRSRFTEALVKGRAWWLCEMPEDGAPAPASRAEWESRGLGDATLAPLDNEQVLDFETDQRGELLWAIVHTIETPRPSPSQPRGVIRETWRIFDRTDVETWAVQYDPAVAVRPEDAVMEGGKRAHGFGRVPLVRLGFTGTRGVKVRGRGARPITVSSGALEGFWLMRRLADPQVAHFRSSAALDWNIKRTCYAMPVFKVEDSAKPPVMGVGYYIMIGTKESAEWIAPPTAHLDVLAARCEHLQQEVYRAANQMAQGVNNNAAAVGRSGESKQADASSTEVVLRVYGAVCREAIEATYSLLSEGRGESVHWSIEGFDVFSVTDAGAVIEAVGKVRALGIPSVTLTRELFYKAADVLLPNADQPTKDAIREEIDAGVEAQTELAEAEAGEGEEDASPDSEDAPPSTKRGADAAPASEKAAA